MKKIASLLVAMVMLLLVPVTALAEGETVTVKDEGGYTNVLFSNGYRGFCVDEDKKGCSADQVFNVVGVEGNIDNNNTTYDDVSHKLKILFTQCFEDLFVTDGSMGYVIDSLKADTSLQSAIWNITDDRYVSGEAETFVDEVNAYDGPEIPDSGYVLDLENGDRITFYFMLMRPVGVDSPTQDFFAYKIEVSNTPSHVHAGGEATCVDKAICEECKEPYGEVDKNNHVGETELRNEKEATEEEPGYTGDVYCKSCDELIEKGEEIPKLHKHEGGEATCVDKATCEECEEPYGEVDKDNHVGDTELRDAKEATEEEPGYTGDVYCKSCDELIEKGEEIPKLHKHEGGEATCVDKATCEECKESYGEVDKNNHVGETELRNEKEATEEEPGYTGDVYCKSCDELIEKGEEIPKLHKHEGGKATCVDKATCEECEEPYGEVDKDNHVGDTELRDAKEATVEEPGYTGDVYCKSCDELIEKGKVIIKIDTEPDEDIDDSSSEDTSEIAPEDSAPEDATPEDTASENSPETGDNLTPYLCLTVMLVSMATFVITLRKKVK